MAKRLLFVCTGNTCRSSMAEALARHWLKNNVSVSGKDPSLPEVTVSSAGLAAWPGGPASPEAIEAMGEMGIDLTGHRARSVSEDLLAGSTLVLTMTRRHKEMLLAKFPQFREKIFTLSEYVSDNGEICPGDIQDPFAQSLHVYRDCALELKGLIDKALRKFLSAEGQ